MKWNKLLPMVLLAVLIIVSFAVIGSQESEEAASESRMELRMTNYNPDLDTGYYITNMVSKTAFGASDYVTFSLTSSDGDIRKTWYNGNDAYAVTGNDLHLHMKVNYNGAYGQIINGSEWRLYNDTWTGPVAGVPSVGTVGTGALVIKTSYDGVNWKRLDSSRYEAGLYTTDYYFHYGTKDTRIFTPLGKSESEPNLYDGMYVHVSYSYEVWRQWYDLVDDYFLWFKTGSHYEARNEWKNYMCVAQFYVQNDNVEGIPFHNLTVTDRYPPEKEIDSNNGSFGRVYSEYETLQNGSLTVTGFMFDFENSNSVILGINF